MKKRQNWLLRGIAVIFTVLVTLIAGWGLNIGTTPAAAAGTLGTWQNRTQIGLDYSKIDSTLTNFPVLVHISASSGENSADLSAVFTNLGTDANRKKIAVTTSDGVTQCDVEIESWSTATKQAYLWVKVPVINAGAPTVLYLYYDATQPDNTAYVGDIGSAPATAVWNSNYVGVWHLSGSYNGTTGEVKDSTANANNGTAGGTGGDPTQQASVIGSGQYFSGNTGTTGGTRPYITIPNSPNYSVTTTHMLTVSWWYVPTVTDDYDSSGGEMDYINMLGKGAGGQQTEWEWTLGGQNSPNKPWEISFYAQSLAGGLGNGGGIYKAWTPGSDEIYCVGTIDTDTNLVSVEIFYPDGTVATDTDNLNGLTIAGGTAPIMIGTGWASNPDQAYKGNLDELEISNDITSNAWNKASYYSESDKLLSYGNVSTVYQQVFSSFVNDNSGTNFGGANWRGQTFTPATTNTLQVIKLKLIGSSSATGNLNVAIRATGSNGLLTGANLSTGSIPCSSISSNSYAVYPITMTNLVVNAGTKYAIIWSAPGMGTGSMSYRVKSPSTSADYAGGNLVDSSNSGSSWGNDPTYEAYFEEWGLPAGAVNQPPVLNAIASQQVTAGQTLSFTISGSDPDGNTLTYSATNLPSGATFNASTKTFSWTPTTSQAGTYSVTFQVSDGSLTASQAVTITVSAPVNHPPVLNAIANQQVTAGQTLSFTISGSDPDGNPLTYSASNLPSGATFNASTQIFSWTPTTAQAGTYSNVTFQVSDGSLTASQAITITVINHPPVLNTIANQQVTAGQALSFTISGSDPDGNALTYSASNLPTGSAFNASTKTFSWTPTTSQTGAYSVTFQVSDGSLTASQTVTITVVAPVNHPPVLNAIANQQVTAGQALTFTISGSDPDGNTLTYSASNLPAGAAFNASTKTFSWTPTTSQTGAFSVTFQVSDGSLTASQTVTITVAAPVNHPPVLNTIANQQVTAGQVLTFSISGSDPDGNTLTYSASNLPAGAAFNTSTKTFSWTPTASQVGTFSVTFQVSDGSLMASQTVTITVSAASNTSALFSSFINDNSGTNFGGASWRGQTFTPATTHTLQIVMLKLLGSSTGTGSINVVIRATDASGLPTGPNLSTGTILCSNISSSSYTVYSITMTNLVVNAGTKYAIIWSAPSMATGSMSYRVKTPSTSADYAGGNLVDSGNSGSTWSNDPTYIAYFQEWGVGNTNQPPVLNAIANQQVTAGQTLSFTISGSDPDGNALTYSAANLPTGASFNAATQTFSWTPTTSQAGTYSNVTFQVSDGSLTASQSITITVVNPIPTLFSSFVNDNSGTNFGGANWRGQTFTPAATHTLQTVMLKLLGGSNPSGNLNVVIRATDANGLPTGPNLSTGTILCSSISSSGYAVYSITMTPFVVNAGTKYAIIWSAPSMASGSMSYRVKTPSTSADYAGGNLVDSSNSGSTWSNDPTYEAYFQEWGI